MAENAKYKKQKQFDILEINSTNHLHILKIHLIGYKTVASKSNLDTKRWKNKNIFPSSQISASMLRPKGNLISRLAHVRTSVVWVRLCTESFRSMDILSFRVDL